MVSEVEFRASLDRLVKGARAKIRDAPHCGMPPGGLELLENVRVAGWSLMLGIYRHDGIEHWHLSAMLWPKNRSSTEHDWDTLGRLLQGVVALSDYPESAPKIEPLTPFESTPPTAVHHWAWHADGSRLDPTAEAMLRKVLGKISAARLPLRRSKPKQSRNAPCLCGSGIKYKKCCGRL